MRLEILDNGVPLAQVLANAYRPDLQQAGLGSGRHGFDALIPGGLSPLAHHVIEVRYTADGAGIREAPVVIEPADRFDAVLEQAVAQAVEALDDGNGRQRALSFMLEQVDRLLREQAEADGRRAERQIYQQFRRRWGPQADSINTDRITIAADPGLRALVIDERVPVAGRDAGSQAILSHMRALQRLGYAVSFIAADEGNGADATALEAAGITRCGPPFYASAEDVLRRQSGCFDVVYLHRAPIAARYLTLARHYNQRARILYSVADLHHLRLERQAAIEERTELLAASRRVRLEECTAAWSADAVITHSTAEAALLRQAVPEAKIHLAGWDLPLRQSKTPAAGRHGIAFIGHYAHAPNFDAALWLVNEIMPLVWQTDSSITCLLVGSAMPEHIRRLAGPNILPVGQIDDLGPTVFDRVRLTVAPLRFGAGIKGKVLESFAVGTPCAMSEMAAEGLPLCATLRALVGGDAAALAALIVGMHSDEAANEAAAQAGQALIRKHFNADATISALRGALKLAPAKDQDAA